MPFLVVRIENSYNLCRKLFKSKHHHHHIYFKLKEEYEPEARFLDSKSPSFFNERTSKMVKNSLATLDSIGELYPVLKFIRYFGAYVRTEYFFSIYDPFFHYSCRFSVSKLSR
jgi:hypothetical protein